MEIENRVAKSGLIVLKLEELLPAERPVAFDLKPFLFKELMLREKDFRAALQETDWSVYKDKVLSVYCSADAIIPVWAWMLVAVHATPFAADIVHGQPAEAETKMLFHSLQKLDLELYRDKRVVVKGCADREVTPAAYAEVARLLQPVVKSLMFGEPCSTVPLYKKKS